MFYDITARKSAIALAATFLLINTTYPGKDKISRDTILNQRTTPHRQRYLYPPKREAVYKKTVQASLYQAVCDKDIRAVKLILSSSTQIDTNKQYGFFQDTILHTAVKKKSPQLATLILNHPRTDSSIKNISIGGPRTALDIALKSGSHNMIKTFTHASNFDPTKRDESGESTINKLEKRNAWWAENLCRHLLRNRLQLDAKHTTAREPMQCIICFETPAEILKAAANHPVDAYKKPVQLMSLTRCCHALLCTQDKTQWLNTNFHRNCPACRKPL